MLLKFYYIQQGTPRVLDATRQHVSAPVITCAYRLQEAAGGEGERAFAGDELVVDDGADDNHT